MSLKLPNYVDSIRGKAFGRQLEFNEVIREAPQLAHYPVTNMVSSVVLACTLSGTR